MDTSYLVLFGFIAVCAMVAVSGAYFRPDAWYIALKKPSWQPPDWLFAPVWTILYAMIAVSGWLVWKKTGFAGAPIAFAIYAIQLVVNALWSAVFFGMHRIGASIVVVALMWLAVAANTIAFYAIEPNAGLLLVPYLLWVSFAAFLNITIWRLNAGVSSAKMDTAS